jgi:hypothetical protein
MNWLREQESNELQGKEETNNKFFRRVLILLID